ncbi:MAG: ribosome maturation factor RimM [Gammaproteobacteria bacterium]
MAAAADNVAGGAEKRVVVGRISGLYGVMGWVKVFSYTRPKQNILGYSPWQIATPDGWRTYRLEEGRAHGKALIARLENTDDRTQAQALLGCDIAVSRRQLPPLPPGEYYWCDLTGLEVFNRQGVCLGRVVEILETGANDVLVIEGEQRHMVPLLMEQYVREVDADAGRMIVDWDPEWT